MIAQVGQNGASALLLAGARADPQPIAVVYLGAALIAGLSGFSLATRSAMTPSLVPADRLPSALALNQVMWSTALIVGPALGGVIVGQAGLAWAYGVDVVSFAATVWGAAIAAFGLVGDRLLAACVFLAVAGGADVVSAVFRSSILQAMVPDNRRGHLSGIHITVVAGGPRIGDAEAGLVATAFSPAVSVVSGGRLCVLGVGVLALLVPEFARYRAGDPA